MPRGTPFSMDMDLAHIKSQIPADTTGLHVVAHAVQDDAFNRTRFCVICLPQTLAAPMAAVTRIVLSHFETTRALGDLMAGQIPGTSPLVPMG